MGMPRRTKGESLQMIHPKAKASSKCKRREAKEDKPIKKWIETMQWVEVGFRREKECSYVANVGGTSTSPI
jgi:hypothetical protein